MENFQLHSIPKNTQEQPDKKIEITNEIQMNLALFLHLNNPEGIKITEDEAMSIFVTSGEHLRFRKLIDNNPEFVQQYKLDPIGTLQKITEKMIENKQPTTYH